MASSETMRPETAAIVLYQSEDSDVPVEVHYLDETFWLSQQEMAVLFGTTSSNVSMHLKIIFVEGSALLNSGFLNLISS